MTPPRIGATQKANTGSAPYRRRTRAPPGAARRVDGGVGEGDCHAVNGGEREAGALHHASVAGDAAEHHRAALHGLGRRAPGVQPRNRPRPRPDVPAAEPRALLRFVNTVKTTTGRPVRRDFARDLRRVYRKPVLWSRAYRTISCGARRCRYQAAYGSAGRSGAIRAALQAAFTSWLRQGGALAAVC